jgi:hypothetical protein
MLERELHEVRTQQRELQHSLQRQREELAIQRLELGAMQNEAAGHREAAEKLRRRVREEFELEAHRNQLDQNRARQMLEIERRLLDAQANKARGDLERAAELAAQAAELRAHLGLVERETREDRVRVLHQELEALTTELQELEAEGAD